MKTGRNVGRQAPKGKLRSERAALKKKKAKKIAAGRNSLEIAAGLDAYMAGKDQVDFFSGTYDDQFRKLKKAEDYLKTFDRPSKGRNKPRTR